MLRKLLETFTDRVPFEIISKRDGHEANVSKGV